jgi:hypothetical protein
MGGRKGETYWYGDEQADIRAELIRYSMSRGLPVEHFAEAVCTCGAGFFRLNVDHGVGVAVRICTGCGEEHLIGDNAYDRFFAKLERCVCPCGQEVFEITGGVVLWEESDHVHWIYLGCRCLACGLLACHAEWWPEPIGYQVLLALV